MQFETEEKSAQKIVEAEATKLKTINKSLSEQEKQRTTLTGQIKVHQKVRQV